MVGFNPQESIQIRRRLLFCGTVFILLLAGVLARAVHLQLTQGRRLGARARQQYVRDLEIAPRRGAIVDRHGQTLATSVDAESVFVVPRLVRDAREKDGNALPEAALARALHLDPAFVHKRVNGTGSFHWLKRRVSPQEAAAVRALDVEKRGVQMVGESRRYYPDKRLAAHVVGTVDVDNNGLEGVEKQEDDLLSGDSHAVRSFRDVKGNVLLDDADGAPSAMAGARVELTIDADIQEAAETALAQQMLTSKALAGIVIAMDPHTGAVLAVANAPNFNPNAPTDTNSRRDRAVNDSYEAGSVMKCFLLAGALSEKVVTPETLIDVTAGQLHIGRKTIHDAERPEHNIEPVREVLAKSSNVGAARIGLMLGPHKLVGWFKAFGFGERTGIGLPAEARGVLQNPARMGEIATATSSFGQGMTASPIQIATALSAIGNDGRLMRPYVVQKITQSDGVVLLDRKPELVREVITPEVAHTLTKMMIGVTQKGGTGMKAAIPGIDVAGKTGTAQKVDPGTGHYGARRFASFMGFAPANDPKVAVYVAFDEPQGEKYGGEVAAPVFKAVATAALLQLGVTVAAPTLAVATPKGKKAPAVVASAAPAGTEELDEGFDDVSGDSGDEDDLPAGGKGLTVVPDVKGCSARGSLRLLHDRSLEVDLDGTGRVVAQQPLPGRQVPIGTHIRVSLGAT